MKKICLGICLTILFLVTGCGSKAQKEQRYEKIMEEYAKQYYEDNMKNVVGQDINQISIQSLKSFNEVYGEKYDVSKLKNCKDTSYTNVIVHSKTREIKEYDHHLECK